MSSLPSPSILLVDDEFRILSALRRTLRLEGYRILMADSPQKALSLLHEEKIDLILSDQKMPGMNGVELLLEASEIHPGILKILLTGWMEDVPREKLEKAGIYRLLPKPWDDAELKAILRQALLEPK